MAGLDFTDKINEASQNITNMEQMLGSGLAQPFNNTGSGARKLMFATHRTHVLPLMQGEKAIIETGYEIRFGDYSSSITRADSDYVVVAKISKFSFAPNHHYYLILKDTKSNKLDVVERISYHHITESYGYLYNNEYLDNLSIGDFVPNNTIVQKSLAFDEYNNRIDGVNFNVGYLSLDDNMEDSIIFSESAAARLTAPLIHPIQIMINDNDIPLNIYGDDNVYKVIPDIGEDIVNANLIALRKENKEESYYAQSVDRLRKIYMSDDKRKSHGKVIDIDIYCNNPDILDNHYYAQLKMYYNELQRMSSEIVSTILPYASQKYEMSYELQKLFAISKRVCNHDSYIGKKPFSNIIINITVLEDLKMKEGDKASNRYGGKGITSEIRPDNQMPQFKDLKGNLIPFDVIFNSATMYGRENPGQIYEIELTHIGECILDKIAVDHLSLEEAYDMIHKYVKICSPEQAQYMDEFKNCSSREELMFFIESIVESGAIHLSMKPISDAMSIDKLNLLYKTFPWIEQKEVYVPMEDSEGNIRYVKARRKMVVGKQYIYRLKQFAEEKFSATSLSSTNIRNENTKSRVKKDFRELYPNTPIRFGNMETNNMNHIGADAVIANMMIHSLSPQGRRLVEQMYTGDPFEIDVKLNSNCKNRSAEIATTYLKTIGRRLKFIRRKKNRAKIAPSPIYFTKDPKPITHPISFVPKHMRDKYDFMNDEMKKENKNAKSPIYFEGIDTERRNDRD